MKTQPSKERVESRVVNRYRKLYAPLIELVDALQDMEPGGTLVDDIHLSKNPTNGMVRIAYSARPIVLTIKDEDCTFILKVMSNKSD